ncbi:MAG: hypothetical protein ACRD0D_09855, partial [Acidimicrobiales bacterium]
MEALVRRLRRLPPAAWVTAAVVGGSMLFVLLQLQPNLIVVDNTPSGGDMGAHVWAPAHLRDDLLPHGRITGWAPDWYAGFPAYHYYFPLPSLVIVALDLFLPYGVAFKLVTAVGMVGLPAAAYAFGRLTRLAFPLPPLLGLATVPFLFDRYHTIWGGNAAATLAGEFSFSIALTLALVFLGVFGRGLETGRGRVLAAGLFGATALCHLIPAVFAVAGAAALFLLRGLNRRGLGFTAVTAALGGAVPAFWLVPFLARLRYSNDMGWERTMAYLENLFPYLRDDVATSSTAHMRLVVVLAAAGAMAGLARRRWPVAALSATALLAAAAFRIVPAGPIWNARFLPFWYLCLYLLAAVAVGEIVLTVANALARARDPSVPETHAGARRVRVAAAWASLWGVFSVVSGLLAADRDALYLLAAAIGALHIWTAGLARRPTAALLGALANLAAASGMLHAVLLVATSGARRSAGDTFFLRLGLLQLVWAAVLVVWQRKAERAVEPGFEAQPAASPAPAAAPARA